VVDCTAIPASLLESEFFGHEKGAFTDARERRIGKFEEAESGTIFLDEIGELPLEAQAKLLRMLQEREVTRVGSNVPIRVDVRVIAATNKHLDAQVKAGGFREDLYYRLNVLTLRLPPLRTHLEDLPLYVHHFLLTYRETVKKPIQGMTDAALHLLRAYEWKGNVREVENVLQRAMLTAQGTSLEVSDVAFLGTSDVPPPVAYNAAGGLEGYIRAVTEQAERQIILQTLRDTDWNRTAAAERLKMSRKTLFNKMQQYQLRR
jgi:DNA-binding NtrC family response regulator